MRVRNFRFSSPFVQAMGLEPAPDGDLQSMCSEIRMDRASSVNALDMPVFIAFQAGRSLVRLNSRHPFADQANLPA